MGKKWPKDLTTETLLRIETPFSFTEAVLELLKTKNHGLPLKTIRGVLKEIERNDVCKELECFSGIFNLLSFLTLIETENQGIFKNI